MEFQAMEAMRQSVEEEKGSGDKSPWVLDLKRTEREREQAAKEI